MLRSACSVNRAATTRSTNFETKLRFDIGRYELASSASSVGFFSRGKTMADLCVTGSSPDCSDALHSALSIGARTSDACFNSQVGTGSSGHCFAGVRDSSLSTSSALTGVKPESDAVTDCVEITGGGALAVEARCLLST